MASQGTSRSPTSSNDDDNKDVFSAKRCFSQIQSRKFWAPLESTSCRLCPSMDLIVLGMMPPSTSAKKTPSSSPIMTTTPILSLHRTVSWQKLATIESAGISIVDEETIEGEAGRDDGITTSPSTTAATTSTTHVCWSPDGRLLAVAGATVELYDVEALASSNAQNGDAVEIGRIMTWKPSSNITSNNNNNNKQPHVIRGMIWAHVGRPHPSCKITEDEVEETVSMDYSFRYLNRATAFLPPSAYHLGDHHNGEDSIHMNLLKSIPSCQTPLSILCIATAEHGILLLLHGRYHIMTLNDTPSCAHPTTAMVCSSDLTHLLVYTQTSNTLSLFSFPSLGKNRFYLQSISALYCAISANIEAIQQQITETAASWKSSLKQLDQKLEPLIRLLQNYGVTDHVKTVLLQFILVGHTTSSSTLSSAMDQFFTGVQMNDQLLQRMERSVSSALANVEKTARQGLLSPARLLVYHIGELFGLARFASDLLPVPATERLKTCSEILLVCAERMVTQLVEARFRIRDVCEWLRATGSQVKARGTATTSVQRDNAKKRRVSQAVVQRMIGYLQQHREAVAESGSLTEHLLSLSISALFHENPPFVQLQSQSPDSAFSSESSHKTPTLPYVTNRLILNVNDVFEHPRNWLSSSIAKTELCLPESAFQDGNRALVEIHCRQGSDCRSNSGGETTGCFAPRVCELTLLGGSNYTFACRNWAIVALACSSSADCNFIQLFAIPLGSKGSEDEDVDDDEDDFGEAKGDEPGVDSLSFYLSTQMILPSSYTVQGMSFYGDDGMSSLSSGTDSGTGIEGRQALGLLVARGEPDESLTQELWIVRYDNLVYEATHRIDSCSDKLSLSATISSKECKTLIRAVPLGCEDIPEERGVVFAKTRVIGQTKASSVPDESGARLLLSGSRGIGGAITSVEGITSLELFDLEEDEEAEEEEEEEEDDE